MIDIYT